MDRLMNPDWWVWSAGPPPCLLSQHSGSLVMLREEEEEEEEAGEHPAACCCSTGCHDQSVGHDAQWSSSRPPILSRIPSRSGPAGRGPGAPPPLQPETAMDAGGGHFTSGRGCWEGPGMETQGCVCVCGQREAGGLGPCWPGSPYVYGVRRNLVVGVEVVEEVAVEDTLEVITEDIYPEELLDAELLQDAPMYPT